MKAFTPALLLLIAVSVLYADPFVVIVRHGEKGTNSEKDPDLSPAGVARAKILGSMLKESGIKAVFATEFKRTQEMAAAATKAVGITPTIIPANDTAGLVSKLRGLNGNALVVGHGNTIPNLIKALGIDDPINIAENDYDQIFLVTLKPGPQLFRLSYPNDLIRFNGYNIKAESSPAK